jgi:hypothetical protein
VIPTTSSESDNNTNNNFKNERRSFVILKSNEPQSVGDDDVNFMFPFVFFVFSVRARERERERERVRKKKVAERGKIGKTSTNFFLLSFYPHKHTRIYTYI